jgi:hypothetical protein
MLGRMSKLAKHAVTHAFESVHNLLTHSTDDETPSSNSALSSNGPGSSQARKRIAHRVGASPRRSAESVVDIDSKLHIEDPYAEQGSAQVRFGFVSQWQLYELGGTVHVSVYCSVANLPCFLFLLLIC